MEGRKEEGLSINAMEGIYEDWKALGSNPSDDMMEDMGGYIAQEKKELKRVLNTPKMVLIEPGPRPT